MILGDEGWKPLYVLGIGGGVLIVVVLTSIACCCVCRHWYAQNQRVVMDKPPDYHGSPPPPYVHSSFYNTNNVNRPRTVHRISRVGALSNQDSRQTASAAGPHRIISVAPISGQSEQNIRTIHDTQDTQDYFSIQSSSGLRADQIQRDSDTVRLPIGRFQSDDIAIVDLDEL